MARKKGKKSLLGRLFFPLLLLFGCGGGLIYFYVTGDLEVTETKTEEMEKNFTKFELCKYILTHDVDANKTDSTLVVFERPVIKVKTKTVVDTVTVVDSVKVPVPEKIEADTSKMNSK